MKWRVKYHVILARFVTALDCMNKDIAEDIVIWSEVIYRIVHV